MKIWPWRPISWSGYSRGSVSCTCGKTLSLIHIYMLTQEDILYRLRCAPVQAIVCTPQDQVPARVAGAVAQAGGACKLWTVQQDIPGFSNLTRAMEEAEDLSLIHI